MPDVRSNDQDADGDSLTVDVVTPPSHGSLEETGEGRFVFRPVAGFVGSDHFVYRVSDGRGGADTATVHLYVANRTYYVDPAGDDSRTGTSPEAAWRTLERAEAHLAGSRTAMPGDVVLLRRGAVFSGSLRIRASGVPGRPVVVGAYGEGARPVIQGSSGVTGWTRVSGSTYKAPAPGPPAYVYADGQRLTAARYPNTGWLRTDGGSRDHLLDAELTAPAGTYDGALVRIHSVNWAFETARVARHTRGRLDYEMPLRYYTAPNDWGYFLEGLQSMLDAPGEWWFDARAGELHVRFPDGREPASTDVRVANVARPLWVSGNHVVVDGLEVRHATEFAIALSYLNHHVVVRDCEVSEAFRGIRGFADDVAVLECDIHDTYDMAIGLDGLRNRVERNRIHHVSMAHGLGAPSWGHFGVALNGSDSVARHNEIDEVGYIALTVSGQNQILEENVVRRGCAILNDGAGISFDGTEGVTIRRNIVSETLGAPESMSSTQVNAWRIAFNIYFGDKNITNTTVEDNVVFDATTGIHIDHSLRSRGNAVTGNLVFGHRWGITFSDYSNYTLNDTGNNCRPAYDDRLLRNTVFSLGPEDRPLHILEVYCLDWVRWGEFDENRYLHPYSTSVVYRHDFQSPRAEWRPGMFGALHEHFTLDQWKAEPVGLDARSTGFDLPWRRDPTPDNVRLLVNPRRGARRVVLEGEWMGVDGTPVGPAVDLPPFTGRIVLRR